MKVRLFKQYSLWSERSRSLHSTFAPGDYVVGEDITEDAAHGAIAAGVAKRIPEKGERSTKRVA